MQQCTPVEKQEIFSDIQHLTRKTWTVLVFVIVLSLLFAAVTRTVYVKAKESQHVASSG